jgi:cytochrome d ubiquinol oxidase subunit II
MTVPLDYETLRVIWWVLLGVLLIGFAVMDGFDLGVAMLLPYVARSDIERRVAINTVGPFWEGNQVWLLLGAGAIFAAWPPVYAASFSGFYIALFLVLVTLILRPVGFDFRNKFLHPAWRTLWDYALFAAGLVPSVVFGVAFGNLLQGVPFRLDGDLRLLYEGDGLSELLNPFALLCGLLSGSMLATHGAIYLTVKTDAAVRERARHAAQTGVLATMILFAIAGIWVWLGIDGYVITSPIAPEGPSNPLLKTVVREAGGWFANYAAHPWIIAAPALAFLALGLALVLTKSCRAGLAFVANALAIAGIITTAGASMFPFFIPSNVAPEASLTVWDSSSSQLTLFVMLLAAIFFLPIVLIYTTIVYRALRGIVTASFVESNSSHLY